MLNRCLFFLFLLKITHTFVRNTFVPLRTRSELVPHSSPWFDQWVPLAVIEDADPRVIHTVTALGKNFIFYRSSGDWKVAEDRCPHRAAPLSEGYINATNGELVCRYHGWSFCLNGKCSAIPQSKLASVADNQRAKLRMYPARVALGLLWMWLSHNQNINDSIAETTSIPIETLMRNDNQSTLFAYTLDNYRNYAILMENTFDPAHAPFVHHGQSGFDRKRALPMENYTILEDISIDGFKVASTRFQQQDPPNTLAIRSLITPYVMHAEYSPYNLSLALMVVPARPGFSRTFSVIKMMKPKKQSSWSKTLQQHLMPKWLQRGLEHAAGAHFEEQDIYMQVKQQLRVQEDEAAGISTQQGWFLPSKADLPFVDGMSGIQTAVKFPG